MSSSKAHFDCRLWIVAVALAIAPGLLGQTEGDLRMEFERKRVRLKISMPATSKGVDISPGKKPPINYGEVVEDCRKHGTAIKEGVLATITSVRKDGKRIEVLLNGGGTDRRKFLKDTRREGSAFRIIYSKNLSAAELTPQALRAALAEYVDFDQASTMPTGGEWETIKARVLPGVVKIIAVKPRNKTETGAGLVVGINGEDVLIVTAYHVVDTAIRIDVLFEGKIYATYPGRRLPRFSGPDDLDVAVVLVESQGGRRAPQGLPKYSANDVRSMAVGARLFPVGHPADLDWQTPQSISLERASDPNDARKLLFTRTSMEEGFSGGPLFDSAGLLIGMITRYTPSYGVAVKSYSILELLREWNIPVSQLAVRSY